MTQGQHDLIGALPIGPEDRSGAVDQRLIGFVGNETSDDFFADELGNARMAGETVENVATVFHRRLFGIEELAEYEFRTGVVPSLAIDERTVVFCRILPVSVFDRPTGEGRSGFIDIHIGIADGIGRIFGARRHLERIHESKIIFGTEGMQFKQFAREVFVRTGAGIGSIVEVIQHRRALGDRFQHRSEIAERVRADHIAVVVHEHGARIEIGRHDVEVVVPEADHHLMQLSFRIHRARQRGALRFPGRTHTNVVGGVGQDVIGPQLGETLAQRGVAGIG